MGQFGIGQAVRRVEDRRFLTGNGQYLADIELPRQLHAYFLRSPHAHALIRRVDAGTARALPGVALVGLGEDLVADGVGTLPCVAKLPNRDGSPLKAPPRPARRWSGPRHPAI